MKKIKKRKINKKRILIILVLFFLFTVLTICIILDIQKNKEIKSTDTKVILICLDGATWNVMMPMVERGELPNFKKIMQNGAYGNLSSDPPLSPPGWTSIATGMKQDKHNVFDFFTILPGSTTMIKSNSLMIKTQTLWQILNKFNKTVGTNNWLMTWPPLITEGFVVPSWFSASNLTYPLNLREELNKNKKIKKISATEENYKEYYPSYDDFWLEREQIETDRLILESQYLTSKYSSKLYAVGFYFTNNGQERFWKYMEPEYYNVSNKEKEKYGSVIFDFYKKIDEFIKPYVDNDDITLIMVSDHGMRGFRNQDIVSGDHSHVLWKWNYNNLLNKLGLLEFKNNSDEIDWSKTKAYYLGGFAKNGININLKEREGYGIVEQKEYDTLKEDIIKKLLSIRFTNQNFIEGKSTNLFNSIEKESFPDIVLNDYFRFKWGEREKVYNKNIIINNEIYALKEFVELNTWSAEHEVSGIFLMKGPNIKKNKLISADVIDVTPTILYLFDLPIGRYMDGRVLTESINEEHLIQNPIKYIDSYNEVELKNEDLIPPDKTMENKLKSLGYIN